MGHSNSYLQYEAHAEELLSRFRKQAELQLDPTEVYVNLMPPEVQPTLRRLLTGMATVPARDRNLLAALGSDRGAFHVVRGATVIHFVTPSFVDASTSLGAFILPDDHPHVQQIEEWIPKATEIDRQIELVMQVVKEHFAEHRFPVHASAMWPELGKVLGMPESAVSLKVKSRPVNLEARQWVLEKFATALLMQPHKPNIWLNFHVEK